MITSGDIDDRKLLEYKTFVDFIYGELVGGKGYINKEPIQRLFVDCIQFITKLKSNMKGSIMKVPDRLLLRKRAIIETVNYELHKLNIPDIARLTTLLSTHCELWQYTAFLCKKPTITGEKTLDRQLALFWIRRTHVK